jgi:hypothetical protein
MDNFSKPNSISKRIFIGLTTPSSRKDNKKSRDKQSLRLRSARPGKESAKRKRSSKTSRPKKPQSNKSINPPDKSLNLGKKKNG